MNAASSENLSGHSRTRCYEPQTLLLLLQTIVCYASVEELKRAHNLRCACLACGLLHTLALRWHRAMRPLPGLSLVCHCCVLAAAYVLQPVASVRSDTFWPPPRTDAGRIPRQVVGPLPSSPPGSTSFATSLARHYAEAHLKIWYPPQNLCFLVG